MALFELCPNKKKKKDVEDFMTCFSQVKSQQGPYFHK